MMKGLLAFALLATSVSAHAIFQELYVNGKSAGHMVGIRVPDYDGPITDVTSNDVICNGGINPYHSPMSATVIDVPAGASLTAEWHHTLQGADPSDSADPIDPSHKGPVMAYLAKVPSATQSSVTGLKWFKIYEDGYNPSTKKWAVDTLISNKGKMTFNVPSCIPAGQYLLRVELIALHAASSYPGAQLYMECAQINVTGGGGASPATVSFPGAYSGSDPGIKVNIYQNLPSYTIPGPRAFTCNAASAPAQTQPPATTSAPASTVAPPASTAAPPASSAPAGSVQHYGQCGGIGYTGATTCVSPYACVKSSDYYSQCL